MKKINDGTLSVGDTFQSGFIAGRKEKFNLVKLPSDTVWTVTRENKSTFSISTKGTNMRLDKTRRVIIVP